MEQSFRSRSSSLPQHRPSSNRTYNIGHYIISKTLGQGTFGKVKEGIHILTGEKVAVKILEKIKIKDKADKERVQREIQILKRVNHPHIIQLYEIIETSRHIYLIMEFAAGGELFDYIVARNKLKEPQACLFFQEILSGLEYLHSIGVVHRDLKPENLLLDSKLQVKIVDFGLSNIYKPNEQLKTACGSPCYAAPEMVAGKKYQGARVDIWSLGIVLYALICGYLPFEDPNTSALYKKIMQGGFKTPEWVSAEARDLLKRVLNTNPESRYKFHEIRKHPWFSLVNAKPVNFEEKINEYVLSRVSDYNCDPDYTRTCIEHNKHNQVTTTYKLLLNKYKQNKELPMPTGVGVPNFLKKETQKKRQTASMEEQEPGFKLEHVRKSSLPPKNPTRGRNEIETGSPNYREPGIVVNGTTNEEPSHLFPVNYYRPQVGRSFRSSRIRVRTPHNTENFNMSLRYSPRLATAVYN